VAAIRIEAFGAVGMIDTTPLPPAVRTDRQGLSDAVLAEIHQRNGARPGAFTLQLVGAWAVIVAVVAWAVHVHAAWATIVAIIVVSTRQNVLGLLVHEQAHLLGYRGKYGDLIVNLFAAYPLLVLTVEDYAQVHLAHHRDYFTDKDPDFLRKSGPEWSVPKRRGELLKLFATDVLGINIVKLIQGKRRGGQAFAFARRYRIPRWVRPAYFVAAAGMVTWTAAWGTFLLYWALPLLTIMQLFVRWGAICEHKYNLPGASVAESTPLIVLSWWERLLLPNLNFAMHPYHHYFPGVAYSKLPEVHAIYLREGLIDEGNVFRGYGAYFRFITRRPDAPAARCQ
jgi:fatty acid desaturase